MFAIGGETEMAGLDDAGMNRADRDLVQAFALGRQEFVRLASVGEPRPRVGRTYRLEARQTAAGAREPDRPRMFGANAGVTAALAGVTEHGDVGRFLVEHRHIDARRIAPQAEQRRAAVRQAIDRLVPAALGHDGAGMLHGYPNSLATFWKPVTSAGGR